MSFTSKLSIAGPRVSFEASDKPVAAFVSEIGPSTEPSGSETMTWPGAHVPIPAETQAAGALAVRPSAKTTCPVDVPKFAPEMVTMGPGRPSRGEIFVMIG
jgi:hypothetical protein